jgi:hypothetical protein
VRDRDRERNGHSSRSQRQDRSRRRSSPCSCRDSVASSPSTSKISFPPPTMTQNVVMMDSQPKDEEHYVSHRTDEEILAEKRAKRAALKAKAGMYLLKYAGPAASQSAVLPTAPATISTHQALAKEECSLGASGRRRMCIIILLQAARRRRGG